MENKKHIFATHISEIGEKNPQLEQDLNVINEMADGGNVPNYGTFIEMGKVYNVKNYTIKNDAVNFWIKTFKIKEFEVFAEDTINKVSYIQVPNFKGNVDRMFKLDFSEIKLKDKVKKTKTAIKGADISGELEVGKTYNVADFDINYYDLADYFDKNNIDKFTIYSKADAYYNIERDNYTTDTSYWAIKISDIIPKSNVSSNQKSNSTLVNVGETYNLNDVILSNKTVYDFMIQGGYQNFEITEYNYGTKQYTIQLENGGPYFAVKSDEIQLRASAMTPIQPTIEPTPTLEDLNLQPASQDLPKPPPEKVNIQMAMQNFIQQNIIGENIFFTPKFVLLESLIELNELSKDKEEDLSSDLESIINNIDSFVIDQCAITPNDSSCGQIPQNIQPITTTKSKSKKSKPMPNMNIADILNNTDMPEELRNTFLSGLNSGNINTIGG